MARQRIPREALLKSVLKRARDLARQVRQTAEYVQEQAKEAHRLTEIARQQAERGRELSREGRREARAVTESIRWSVGSPGKAGSHGSGDGEV
jgi:methyl-accepting chemotaxis protein